MSEWIRVAKTSDFSGQKGILVHLEDRPIALFRSGNDFYAIDNSCPHRGAPLSEGFLENKKVTCAWHAWEFDVNTGECAMMPGTKIGRYPVKVQKDEIFIKI